MQNTVLYHIDIENNDGNDSEYQFILKYKLRFSPYVVLSLHMKYIFFAKYFFSHLELF